MEDDHGRLAFRTILKLHIPDYRRRVNILYVGERTFGEQSLNDGNPADGKQENDIHESVEQNAKPKPLPRSLALEPSGACETLDSALATKLAVLVLRPRSTGTKEKALAKVMSEEELGGIEDTHKKPPTDVRLR